MPSVVVRDDNVADDALRRRVWAAEIPHFRFHHSYGMQTDRLRDHRNMTTVFGWIVDRERSRCRRIWLRWLRACVLTIAVVIIVVLVWSPMRRPVRTP